jgi:hypothetical protein
VRRGESIEGRGFDRRTVVRVAARMDAFDQPSIRQMIEIENISCWGARIVSGRLFSVHDSVVISDYGVGHRAVARVVYCQSRDDGRFAIGVKFRESLVDKISGMLREPWCNVG